MSVRISHWLLCLSLTLACLGCSPSSNSSAKSKGRDKLLIAVVPKATSHEFWKAVHTGAVRGAIGADVEIIWKGPLTEGDREGQVNLVQDFIAQAVDGICLAPLDSQALIPVVHEAAESDIPTLIFDSGLDNLDEAISFVATDNFHGGEMAAQHLGKLLGGKGRVIVLRYTVGSQSSGQREEGFLETLKKEFPDIEVISSNEYAGDTADKALVKAQQLLLTFGDKVDGVFTPAQHVSTGMLRALEEQNLAGKVKFVGLDAGPELVQALRDGKMQGIVLQNPARIGELSVLAMAAYLRGDRIDSRIATGETLATPENMDEPEVKELLEPELYEE